jgi:hypothetical protein
VRGRFHFHAQGRAAVTHVTAVTPPEIDVKIRALVDALNAFDGVATLGSCGGHPEPLEGGQWPEGTWYVTFKIRHDTHGWRALEFLAWLINHDYTQAEPRVRLYPDSVPPYLNTPGSMLKFALEGCECADPAALATVMNQLRQRCFISATKRTRATVLAPRRPARDSSTRRR